MTEIIQLLCDEHRNVERLLGVLEQELAVFDRRERPDYEILQALVAFFEDHGACCHDPKETLVLDLLKTRDPEAAAMIAGLEAEHSEDPRRLQRFAQMLTGILSDHDLPRQAFDDAVQDFIAHARRQMDFEERVLFPAALRAFDAEDWAAVDTALRANGHAAANGSAQEKCRVLHDRILEWEQANVAARC